MSADHDLDRRLAEAGGIRDEDLPALPSQFLTYLQQSVTTSDDAAGTGHGNLGSVGQTATLLAARQQVDDATERRLAPRHLRRRSTRRRTYGLLAVGVAASLVTGVVVVGAPGGTPFALADYSPTPTVPTDERLAQFAAACGAAVAGATQRNDQAGPAITDLRGAWGLTVFDGRKDLGLCLVHETEVAGVTVEAVSVVPATSNPVTAGISTDAVAQSSLESAGADVPYTAVVGRTSPDVSSVELTLESGQTVEATVRDGWWAAWWPTSGDAEARRQTYTTTDGQTTTRNFSTGS